MVEVQWNVIAVIYLELISPVIIHIGLLNQQVGAYVMLQCTTVMIQLHSLTQVEPPSYMKYLTIKKALHQIYSVLAQSYKPLISLCMVYNDYSESQ